jgi:RHS repeat-associated protein
VPEGQRQPFKQWTPFETALVDVQLLYDDANHPTRLTEIKDVIGRSWKFGYNSTNGRMIYLHYPTDTTVPASKMRFVYYVTNWRIKRIHARYAASETELQWAYAYDGGGVLTQVDDPVENSGDPNNIYNTGVGDTITFLSGVNYYVREITDKRGEEWTWHYDDDSVLKATVDPLLKSREFEYDSDRNVTKFTNEFSKDWTATYGPVGNLLTLTTPITNQTWTYTWEAVDPNTNFYRVTKVTDPAGHWTEYQYADSASDPNEPDDPTKIVRVIEQAATGGGSTATTKLQYYDDEYPNFFGHLRLVTDANGVKTAFYYDRWGYPAGLDEGLMEPMPTSTTLYPFEQQQKNNALGWVIGADDRPNGPGRMCCADDVTYDANGNPVVSCSCSCRASDEYEILGDVPSAEFPRGKQSLEETSYDVRGLPLSLERGIPELVTGSLLDTVRTHTFTYDDFLRLDSSTIESTNTNGTPKLTRSFEYTSYDPDGRVLGMTGPDGETTDYTYDELGRLSTIDRDTMSADLFYFKDSTLKRVEYGNGTQQVRAYDDARRLMSIDHQDPNGVSTLKIEYDWTINNLVERRTETVGSDIWEVDFAYDNRNRLTRETRTKTSAEPDVVEYDIEYEYDQLGNRTVRTDNVAERETFYNYDVDVDPNQLTYATHHNRLLSYEVYDTSGPSSDLLRTVKYTYYDTGQASNITVFDEQQTPDPNAHIWHHDVALHYYTHGPLKLAVWGKWQEDENGPIDSTYQVIKAREFRWECGRARYMYADIATPQNDSQYWTLDGDPAWTDYEGDTPYADSTIDPSTYALTPVNRFFGLAGEKDTSSGDESYRQADLIGSTMATTDDTGSIGVSPVSYTAFGEPIGDFSGMPRYQYAGAWGYESGLIEIEGADSNLEPIKLQHLGWRWYQPNIGRFVQRDPIGLRGGLNPWTYVGNGPSSTVDPMGLDPVTVVKIVRYHWTLLREEWVEIAPEVDQKFYVYQLQALVETYVYDPDVSLGLGILSGYTAAGAAAWTATAMLAVGCGPLGWYALGLGVVSAGSGIGSGMAGTPTKVGQEWVDMGTPVKTPVPIRPSFFP